MTSEERFLKRLQQLDAAAKAALRSSAGSPHTPDVVAHDAFTAAWWPIRNSHLPRDVCRMVAALYFWHPKAGGNGNLIESLLRAANHGRLDRGPTERLVEQLLAASFAALPGVLLVAVQWLAKARVSIDWPQLIRDLSRWDRPAGEESVQEAWANTWLQTGGKTNAD